MIDQLDASLKELDQAVAKQAEKNPSATLLMTHPGVGPVTSLAFVLTLGPVERFERSKQVVSYLGLNPREHSSGGRQRLGSISKQGNRQLRTLLVVGASSIIKQAKRGVPLPVWLTRLMARKPHKLVAVALANKNARIIWALLAKGGVYRKPQTVLAAAAA